MQTILKELVLNNTVFFVTGKSSLFFGNLRFVKSFRNCDFMDDLNMKVGKLLY